jgi:hypothetical protein
MTRKGHLLDHLDVAPPVRKPTTTSPWAGYLRCDECGADAGKVCRDMDDLPALEVCDGRRLFLGDSVDMTRRPKSDATPSRRDAPPDTKPQAKSRRERGLIGEPRYAPCQHCGVSTRLWGRGCLTGRAWCSAAKCKAARNRACDARRRAIVMAPCRYCGAPRHHGRKDALYPSCGAVRCRSKAKAEREGRLTPSADTL